MRWLGLALVAWVVLLGAIWLGLAIVAEPPPFHGSGSIQGLAVQPSWSGTVECRGRSGVITEVTAVLPSGYEVKLDTSTGQLSQRIGMSSISVVANSEPAAGDWVRGRAVARFSDWEVVTLRWDCGHAP